MLLRYPFVLQYAHVIVIIIIVTIIIVTRIHSIGEQTENIFVRRSDTWCIWWSALRNHIFASIQSYFESSGVHIGLVSLGCWNS